MQLLAKYNGEDMTRTGGEFSIMVAIGDDEVEGEKIERYYLPNQKVRSLTVHESPSKPVWFCHGCMRKVEDNFRATVDYLKKENS